MKSIPDARFHINKIKVYTGDRISSLAAFCSCSALNLVVFEIKSSSPIVMRISQDYQEKLKKI